MKPFLAFTIPGEPQPKERARYAAAYKKDAAGQTTAILVNGRPIVRTYTPESTAEYENLVAQHTVLAVRRNPAWLEIAKSKAHFRMHFYAVTTDPTADGDNIEKSLLDGMMKANQFQMLAPKKLGGKPRKGALLFGAFRDDCLVKQCDKAVEVRTDTPPRLEVYLTTASEPLGMFLWQAIAIENGWSPPRAAERQAL